MHNARHCCAVRINSLAEHQEDYTDLWMKRRLRFRRSSLSVGSFGAAAQGGGCINRRKPRRAAAGERRAKGNVIKHDWMMRTCAFHHPCSYKGKKKQHLDSILESSRILIITRITFFFFRAVTVIQLRRWSQPSGIEWRLWPWPSVRRPTMLNWFSIRAEKSNLRQ